MAKIWLGNIKGEKGEPGSGLRILGFYATPEALYSAIPNPSVGDAYGIGDSAPYDIYVYSEKNGWVNNGALAPDINEQTPNYVEATTLESLSSGEKISLAFGKIKKAISELISHLGNKSNPHGVTAAQTGALPISGGVISGRLGLANGYGSIASDKNCTTIITKNLTDSFDNSRQIYFVNSNYAPNIAESVFLHDIIEGETDLYYIFGEHNKPSSTYRGNGSAEGITVNIGGKGKALLLYGSGTLDDSPFIVTRSGAFGKGGSTCLAFSRDVINFTGGVLTIKTDSPYFNADSTYAYQVL